MAIHVPVAWLAEVDGHVEWLEGHKVLEGVRIHRIDN